MTVSGWFEDLSTVLRERRGRIGGRRNELPEQLELDFDRRALVPRLFVTLVLGAGALLEFGHGHRLAHWVVLAVYGATTVALALSTRFAGRPAWLPVAATVADAGLTVYVITDHLPQDAHDAPHATDAVSLLPAFLLLLQTGSACDETSLPFSPASSASKCWSRLAMMRRPKVARSGSVRR
jgi:hypothetical protein